MAEVPDSILDTTKRLVGLDPSVTDFDAELIVHINSAFFTLQQLGIGPRLGFLILDNTSTWAQFIQGEQIAAVKSYMGLKVQQLFDPPSTGPLSQALERQLEQFEWRLNIQQENVRAFMAADAPDTITPEAGNEGFHLISEESPNLMEDPENPGFYFVVP